MEFLSRHWSGVFSLKGKFSSNNSCWCHAKGKLAFLSALKFGIDKFVLACQFPYIPECPIPILGREVFTKLNAQIMFEKEKSKFLAAGSSVSMGWLGLS